MILSSAGVKVRRTRTLWKRLVSEQPTVELKSDTRCEWECQDVSASKVLHLMEQIATNLNANQAIICIPVFNASSCFGTGSGCTIRLRTIFL
jgi:hypothetical protein